MNRLLPLVLLLLNAAATTAQYGNEWIDYDRQYWKFEVYTSGVFRIDQATLAQSGFPAGIDPRRFMLFGREKQVPIYVHGEGDGEFGPGDFIEFQADRNDGWVNGRQYPYPGADPNPYYSLYSDTLRYFLTWDDVGPTEHIALYNNTSFGSYTARDWAMVEAIRSMTDFYFVGYIDAGLGAQGITATSGLMLESEGFGGFPLFSTGATVDNDVVVPTPGGYNGPGAPNASVLALCAAQDVLAGSQPEHHLQYLHGPGLATIGVDTIFSDNKVIRGRFEIPPSEIGFTTTIRYRAVHDITGIAPDYLDWQVPSALAIRYPRAFSFSDGGMLRMWLPDAPADPLARITLHSFGGTPVFYAWGDTVRRITGTVFSGAWNALIPATPNNDTTRLYLFAQENVVPITSLRPVNGTGFFTDLGALDLDSAMLIVAPSALMESAEEYADYRQNESDNRYNTLLVEADELYDQFGGGVPKNAGAIRTFCKYLLDTWSTDPRALFLIGKSVNTWSAFFSNQPGIRPNSGGAYENCLLPSYGYPSSDQCFTTGLSFDSRRMDIPVGRLSATSNEQVRAYLDKVRDTEGQAPAMWQKNILHFAGGTSLAQVQQLSGLLNIYGQTAEAPSFGGNTVLFPKVSSDIISPLEAALADSVRGYIEDEGVTLMTFFAHAYSSSFDITIDAPQNYDWNGKHPMVIGNSCYIGNIHLNGALSTSEQWVLTPDAGPIAFMATTDIGSIGQLFAYTNEFYRSFGLLNYGGTVGDHMKHAGLQAQISSPTAATAWSVHTFALEGDPTLTLNVHPLPDYAISSEEVFFEPAVVTADQDTITVKVVVNNQGKAIPATINLELLRTNPGLGANAISYFTTLDNIYLRDTAEFRVPALGTVGGQGVNQFEVRVDLEPDQVDELEDLANNVATTTLFITSGDLVPVYPYDFAIVPDPVLTLKASTGDPLAPPRNYLFQIDTTDLFNSPIMESTMFQAPGGVVSWQPPGIFAINTLQDSTVFYWRCSIDSVGNNGAYNWYERSFQYIAGKNGWGQAHYFQFKDDDFSGIIYDRPERDFDFFQGLRNVRAEVLGNVGGPNTQWFIELAAQDYGGCGPAAWHVAVVDPATFEAWGTYFVSSTGQVYNPDHQFGNGNNAGACRNRPEAYFSFHTNVPSELAGMQNMLNAGVPDGHHLLLFTWLYLDKDGMAANAPGLAQELEELGIPDFDALQDSVPYIFYVRKGDPTTFQDTIGTLISDQISLSVFVPTASSLGYIGTPEAGPAAAWQALYWNERPSNALDTTRIKLYGIPAGEVEEVELMDLPSAQDSVPNLGALVSAQQYPILRIKGAFRDGDLADTQPAQLERWQLLSSPAPECAIHPPLGYFNGLNGWAEGQEASVAVAVQNISAFDMDSLLLAAWVIDANNQRQLIHYHLNAPLLAGAWLVDTVRFNTLAFGGTNTLVIEANPVDTVTGQYHQLEQYHFNNIVQWRFDVDRDRENPILDVTFDGMHILDGDIVSARPEILITLDDENTVRLLDSPADTASFDVFLVRPDQQVGEQIRFRDGAGNEVMQFIPANGEDNIAKIHYRPVFAADGKYGIVVRARDLSNNESGDNDYKVNFEVINRSTITEVLNYPNPFTTSTRFVFTVTGTEPPTNMKIQIMTVTGRVVREVKMHELGPLRVGRNITEYAWDGTDEFGDRLGRGVYLYRVIAQINGSDIELRETDASAYFNKGFGKMYLLR